jgi:hypothetical protein
MERHCPRGQSPSRVVAPVKKNFIHKQNGTKHELHLLHVTLVTNSKVVTKTTATSKKISM